MTNDRYTQSTICWGPRGRAIEIARVAAGQHGLVTASQLHAIGMSRHAIAYAARSGSLHRIHSGVYAVGHPALSQHARWLAAVLAVGDGSALSHLAAASLLGIWRRKAHRPHVVSARYHRPLQGASVHSSCTLRPRDITTREHIPVTTVPRILLDLGDVLTAHQLANVMHEAAFRDCMDVDAVRAQLARSRGRHTQAELARALDLHVAGSAGARSDLEERTIARLRSIGAAEPRVNTHVNAGGRLIEVDLYWPDLGLVVEIDGSGHNRRRTRREDERRDRALTCAGYRVERWSVADLNRGDEWIASRMRKFGLAAGTRTGF